MRIVHYGTWETDALEKIFITTQDKEDTSKYSPTLDWTRKLKQIQTDTTIKKNISFLKKEALLGIF